MPWTRVTVYMPEEMKRALARIAKKEGYLSLSEMLRSLARYKIEKYPEIYMEEYKLAREKEKAG